VFFTRDRQFETNYKAIASSNKQNQGQRDFLGPPRKYLGQKSNLPMASINILKIVLQNTGSNALLFAVRVVLTFIMTPVLVHNLGNYDYGIWEVIAVVVGYMGMLDIGIVNASSRYAANYKATNDQESLNKVYSTALSFMAAVSVIVFTIMLLWSHLKPEVLAPDPSDAAKYSFLIIIIGIRLLFSFPGQIAEGFLEGFQKYRLKNNITLVNSIIGNLIILYFITPENGLILLAMVNALGLSIKYIIYILLLRSPIHGGLRYGRRYFCKSTLVDIATFGFKSFIQGISSNVIEGSDKIIIAYILGPTVIVYFAISANLTQYISNIRMMLSHAFMPLFTQFHANEDIESTHAWFFTGSKMIVALLLVLTFGVFLLGKEFIAVWIGPEYAKEGAWVLYILTTYHITRSMNPFSVRYLTAINKHGHLATLTTAEAIANIIISIVLIQYMGIEGAAL